jgi:NADPH:quinone reductase-like Zn-dependent oxidoreductase
MLCDVNKFTMATSLQNLPTTRQVYRRSPRSTDGSSTRQSLILRDEPIPDLSPTSLLIHVRAISLNYRDANILHGTNPWDVAPHGIPCSDCAGLVIAIGTKVTRFNVGDRVTPIFDQKSITGYEQEREWLGGEVDGILATHVVFDEEKVVRIPDGLSWAEASLLPCAGVTSWSGLGLGRESMAGKTVLLMG